MPSSNALLIPEGANRVGPVESDRETKHSSILHKDDHTAVSEVSDRIRTKNRRKRYLELHPEYFGTHLELADPLLYDRLIRRFQTPSEREAEGRKKGYSGVLEADLYRGEAKLNALQHPDPLSDIVYRRGRNGEILAEEKDDVPVSKDDGLKQWTEIMERRFIEGRDPEFDYARIDGDDKFDDLEVEEREAQERWFDDETPEWVDEQGSRGLDMELKGATGVQDY